MSVNENLDVVITFVRSLISSGVTDVCISPGSRSTPLVATMVREPGLRVWSLLDERSAGFFALGLAKTKGKPVALVCTSGTATANYLPAVVEASLGEVPLIVLTADRPFELRDVGSNQTIHQVNLYGNHVKWFCEMPVPDAEHTYVLHRHAKQIARRAVSHASGHPRGPVHINYPFREPLMPPIPLEKDNSLAERALWHGGMFVPDPAVMQDFQALLRSAQRPLFLCGPQEDEGLPEALASLGRRFNAPILADPLSQLRRHPAASPEVVLDGYDLFLRHRGWRETMKPDLVLRFGRTPTSKAVLESLSAWSDVPQVVVHSGEGWADPAFTGTHFVRSDPAFFCSAVGAMETGLDGPDSLRRSWLEQWQTAAEAVRSTILQFAADEDAFALEGRLFLELSQLVPEGSALFIGNSMPIRHADTFLLVQAPSLRLFGNRGASGIDGVVSSAFGVAAGHDEPVVLVIGDVSMYHDLNGLLAASRLGLSLLIVLVHNDGGGIFTFLPQSQFEDVVTAFTTPHGIEFRDVVRMYGGTWHEPSNWSEFRDAVQTGIDSPGLQVVQIKLDKEASHLLHRSLVERTLDALEAQMPWLAGRR